MILKNAKVELELELERHDRSQIEGMRYYQFLSSDYDYSPECNRLDTNRTTIECNTNADHINTHLNNNRR